MQPQLFKKVGRKYEEVTPAEIIHCALKHIRDAGHADLATATELKLIEAVFAPPTENLSGGRVTR